MKKLIILLLSIFLIGMAGAVTMTETPTAKFGPNIGFWNPGTIQAADLYATDDFLVGDDAQFLGDVAVTGAVTFDGITASGIIKGEQLTSTDDATIYDGLTTNVLVVNTTSALNGDVTTGSGIDINMSGAAVLRGVTGTFTGTVQGEDLRSTDDALVTDDLVVDGLARIDESLTANSVVSNGTISGTAITGSGIIKGEHLTSTDDATVYDTLTTNVLVVNTTSALNGDVTTGSGIDINMSGAAILRGVTGTFTGAVSGTSITGSGTVQGEQVNSTDDMKAVGTIMGGDIISNTSITGGDLSLTGDALVTDDIIVDGAARIDETATVNALVSNTTVSAAVDGIRANSVIVPAYETLIVPISASSVDEYVFVSDDPWWLVKVEEIHVAAGTEVAPIAANLTIRICDNAEAVTGGINATTAVIPLNSAANTFNTATLNSTNSLIADADMIAFDYAGTLTGLRGSVTLTLRRM